MIEAIYEDAKGKLTVQGHAGAGRYGSDLICAAASILVHTAIRGIGNDAECRTKPGFAEIIAGDSGRNVMRVIIGGFEWLAENYPGNVKAERR